MSTDKHASPHCACGTNGAGQKFVDPLCRPLNDSRPTPLVGRIIHVIADPKTNNGADVAPAIITRVWSDTVVNVRVLFDGSDAPWWTSISLYPDREAADAKIAEVREQLIGAGHDPLTVQPRAGFWPARV